VSRTRWTVLIAVVAFLSAIAGVFVGRALIASHGSRGGQLHELLHHDLKLDAGQQARIRTIERRFAVRRHELEADIRADNARLAAAIEAEHGNGPQVAAAVDASHAAMGALQKETLAHVFAMRQVLRPDQTAAFDHAVARSLTADAR
jgi:hypothetical protein